MYINKETRFFKRLGKGLKMAVFFVFWLIIEGATEKVLQFIIQLKSMYNQNLGFIEQKMYFWTQQRGSHKKKSI